MKRIALLLATILPLLSAAVDIPLSWTAVTNSTTLWGYQIYYGYETNSIQYNAPFVTTNSTTVSNLQAVTYVHFQIAAVNSNSVSSARSSIFTVTNATPATPTGITTP